MRAIGLTGGIGSGKSTVASMFAQSGVPVLDLDQVGKIFLKDKSVQDDLCAAFGDTVVKQGVVQSTKLAAIAFGNEENTKRLNAILHPHIYTYEQQWLAEQTGDYAIIEASVLIESGGVERMDTLVVVMADEAVRKARVLARGKQDEWMFERIVKRQCDDDSRLLMANYLLDNDGDMDGLQQQVLWLTKQLIA